MLETNKKITYSGEELLKVLNELNLMAVSFDKIVSYYGDKMDGHNDEKVLKEYDNEVIKFIRDWNVPKRIAKVREILSVKFDTALGDDDMDDLERAAEHLKYWSKPNDKPE